jgi:hypothetical protein
MSKIRFTLVIVLATFLANTAYADTTFTWKFTVKDKNTGAPLNAIPVSCDFIDRKDDGKSSKNECITDTNGQCSIVNKGNGGFFSSSNMQASCKPATTGYKNEYRSTTKSMSDGATFLMEMTPVTAEELLEAARKIQLEKDGAILLAQKVEKEKLETAALNLKKQEEADEIAKLKALHKAEIESKKDVSIFGIVMGLSTMDDVDELADTHEFTPSDCKRSKTCRFKNITPLYSGFINGKSYNFSMDNSVFTFAEFSIDSEKLNATFYENKIIELRVGDSKKLYDFPDRLVKELRQSLDKKYKRIKSTKVVEKSDMLISTITHENWTHPQMAFEIALQNRVKLLLIPESVCLSYIHSMQLPRIIEIDLELDCRKILDNDPVYGLSYRDLVGYKKAAAEMYESPVSAVEKNAANKKSVSKY